MKLITCSGGLFLSKTTKRFLFLLRDKGKTANTWGFVGGKKEPIDLTPYDTLTREINEEVGKTPVIKKVIPLTIDPTTPKIEVIISKTGINGATNDTNTSFNFSIV
jgi:8-oxo-dGTP pyrophosphatase MutT (NUDIX family)